VFFLINAKKVIGLLYATCYTNISATQRTYTQPKVVLRKADFLKIFFKNHFFSGIKSLFIEHNFSHSFPKTQRKQV
jgi:hypothetical protein